MTPWKLFLGAAALASTLACASPSAGPSGPVAEYDPVEGLNRPFFSLNDGLDVYVIEPTAKGWRFILRGPGTRAVDRFFTNLEFPIRFVGNLLQAEGYHATEEFGRFLVNTTVGIAGFFDPATPIGLGLYEEDVGQAFGSWGIGPGAYLVIPLLGPSDVRDFIGGTADSALLGPASIARTTIGNLNSRALVIEEVDEIKEASLDYYAFVRNAYLTTRLALVENRDPEASKPQVNDSLYDDVSDEAEPKEEPKP